MKYAVYVRWPWAGDGFVVGATQPSSANTGVPAGTTLATLLGDQTITTAGTVIENKRIEGRVLVQTSGVVLRNCEIVGTTAIFENAATTVVGLVECFGTGRSVTLERCTLRPQQPLQQWPNQHPDPARCPARHCLQWCRTMRPPRSRWRRKWWSPIHC